VGRWIDEAPGEVPGSPDELRAETAERIQEWNSFGRALSGAFLQQAEGVASAAA
jgi:hypothetical protein